MCVLALSDAFVCACLPYSVVTTWRGYRRVTEDLFVNKPLGAAAERVVYVIVCFFVFVFAREGNCSLELYCKHRLSTQTN